MKSFLIMIAFGLLVFPLLGCGKKSEDRPLAGADPDLNGIWLVTRMEESGVPLRADQVKKIGMTYTLENGSLTVKTAKGDTQTMTYTVDPSSNPKRISFDVKGVKSKDVYEINGKELKICISRDGTKYPDDCASRPNSTDLMVFVRK